MLQRRFWLRLLDRCFFLLRTEAISGFIDSSPTWAFWWFAERDSCRSAWSWLATATAELLVKHSWYAYCSAYPPFRSSFWRHHLTNRCRSPCQTSSSLGDELFPVAHRHRHRTVKKKLSSLSYKLTVLSHHRQIIVPLSPPRTLRFPPFRWPQAGLDRSFDVDVLRGRRVHLNKGHGLTTWTLDRRAIAVSDLW